MYASSRDEAIKKKLREIERDQGYVMDSMILKAISRERDMTNKRIEQ